MIFPFAESPGSDLLDIAGPVGLMVFAARFPDDRQQVGALGLTGWRFRSA